jgi:hypothetical protein
MRETGRENAFCAPAIFGAPSMVEAFEDLRVAENPFVTEPPHVRFSAGHPLRALTGRDVGTPWIIDPGRSARQTVRSSGHSVHLGSAVDGIEGRHGGRGTG